MNIYLKNLKHKDNDEDQWLGVINMNNFVH